MLEETVAVGDDDELDGSGGDSFGCSGRYGKRFGAGGGIDEDADNDVDDG